MIMESSFCWDALTPQADGTPNNGAWESPARAAPGLPIQPTPASQGHENSRIGSKPATCSSMSLERYLEHYSLLTHDTGRVKILNPLEQSMLRMQDLKQVLSINGISQGNKPTRREILDRLPGSALVMPGKGQGDAASPLSSSMLALDAGVVAALPWVGTPTPALLAALSSGACSCCPLPLQRITVRLPAETVGQTPGGSGDIPASVKCTADPPVSAAGAGSPPARAAASLAAAGLWAQVTGNPPSTSPCAPQTAPQAHAPLPATHRPRLWLERGLAELARHSCISAHACDGALLGRKVAVVLLEDFVQELAEGTGGHTVPAGLHAGKVVEVLDPGAHTDACPRDCRAASHRFAYVRLRCVRCGPGGPSAPVATEAAAGERLDLLLDLSAPLQVLGAERLRGMPTPQLQDAWMLLEPLACSGGRGEAPPASKRQARQGPWSSSKQGRSRAN
ncbi:hypothetical protein ACKKBG_A27115 [Auxenochlorella protothecoides x Auxenochlorella symbiontica]